MTTADREHVSTFALDVLWASEGSKDSRVADHVDRCARCRGYLAMLDSLRPNAASIASASERGTMPGRSRQRGWGRGAMLMGTLAVAALVVALGRRTSRTPQAAYVAAKGSPALQVLVHRGTETRAWDGQSAVRPGDSLALRVACEGLEHVSVASPGAGGWGLLAEASCPRREEPLPFTLLVDEEPGTERLALVMSKTKLDEASLRKALAEGARTKEVWVVTLAMPKETGR